MITFCNHLTRLSSNQLLGLVTRTATIKPLLLNCYSTNNSNTSNNQQQQQPNYNTIVFNNRNNVDQKRNNQHIKRSFIKEGGPYHNKSGISKPYVLKKPTNINIEKENEFTNETFNNLPKKLKRFLVENNSFSDHEKSDMLLAFYQDDIIELPGMNMEDQSNVELLIHSYLETERLDKALIIFYKYVASKYDERKYNSFNLILQYYAFREKSDEFLVFFKRNIKQFQFLLYTDSFYHLLTIFLTKNIQIHREISEYLERNMMLNSKTFTEIIVSLLDTNSYTPAQEYFTQMKRSSAFDGVKSLSFLYSKFIRYSILNDNIELVAKYLQEMSDSNLRANLPTIQALLEYIIPNLDEQHQDTVKRLELFQRSLKLLKIISGKNKKTVLLYYNEIVRPNPLITEYVMSLVGPKSLSPMIDSFIVILLRQGNYSMALTWYIKKIHEYSLKPTLEVVNEFFNHSTHELKVFWKGVNKTYYSIPDTAANQYTPPSLIFNHQELDPNSAISQIQSFFLTKDKANILRNQFNSYRQPPFNISTLASQLKLTNDQQSQQCERSQNQKDLVLEQLIKYHNINGIQDHLVSQYFSKGSDVIYNSHFLEGILCVLDVHNREVNLDRYSSFLEKCPKPIRSLLFSLDYYGLMFKLRFNQSIKYLSQESEFLWKTPTIYNQLINSLMIFDRMELAGKLIQNCVENSIPFLQIEIYCTKSFNNQVKNLLNEFNQEQPDQQQQQQQQEESQNWNDIKNIFNQIKHQINESKVLLPKSFPIVMFNTRLIDLINEGKYQEALQQFDSNVTLNSHTIKILTIIYAKLYPNNYEKWTEILPISQINRIHPEYFYTMVFEILSRNGNYQLIHDIISHNPDVLSEISQYALLILLRITKNHHIRLEYWKRTRNFVPYMKEVIDLLNESNSFINDESISVFLTNALIRNQGLYEYDPKTLESIEKMYLNSNTITSNTATPIKDN